MLKIDSHQHFWLFDPVRDSWITEDMQIIRNNFLPEDLKPILDKNNIGGCIAVQADQSEAETTFLLNLAEKNSFIKGVVGWVDLRSSDLKNRLEHWKSFPKLKGFRHILQAEQEGFMLDPEFIRGIAALSDFGYIYDILINSSQIKEVTKLVELNPAQNFVLDHLGKPNIKNGDISLWASDMKELAARENVFCKLSGMVTEADLANWNAKDIHPYLDIVVNVFGVKRVMFGSDWPVCKLAAEYEEVCELLSDYIEQLSTHEKEMIWSENAIKFYSLG